jgi:hypothetical protein
MVSSDGSSRAAGLRITVNGRLTPVDVIRDNLTRQITGGGGDNIALGERCRDRGFKLGLIDDFRVWNRELSAWEAMAVWNEPAARALLARPESERTGAERDLLLKYYLAAIDPEWQTELAALRAARSELAAFVDRLPEIMVMRELPHPKPAYVLWRGDYSQRREQVQPGTPAILRPFPEGAPRNRLGLAKWLTDRQHPLFARVSVNRFWQSLFGTGLVKTAEDFGAQGARPIYPELLDWLALQFIDSGWDVKLLLRTMVVSHTYRQMSVGDEARMADDPGNEWLARGPRFRLPAETIRDNALSAAGLLRHEVGGPPVNPYEMAEAFKPMRASGGSGVYRRSIYTTWRRTSPPPALVTFDAPRRAVCTVRRERTDSPLQALILLNGTQYVEAARVLGESLHRSAGGDVHRMIETGFLTCLSRRPDARELDILARLYEEQRSHFERQPAAAEELLHVGTAPRDETIGPAAAAAATMLAQALLNHDACVVKP